MDTVSESHAEASQATASEGLAQGPYVAARAVFQPVTLRTKATNLPMSHHVCMYVTMYEYTFIVCVYSLCVYM